MITGTIDRTCKTVLKELQKNNYSINTIYDIGANDGRWTRKWSPIFPQASFFMFEANPDNVVIPRPNDRFFTQVLSDKNDRIVTFYTADTGKENTGDSYYKELTHNYNDNNMVQLMTKKLDTFVKENKLPQPDFIKLDTQGAEVDIIKGGSKTLKNCKVILTEIPVMRYNDGAPNFSKYIDILYDNDFVPTGVDHIAIRKGILNQMDIVFLKKDIAQDIHNYKERYKGF